MFTVNFFPQKSGIRGSRVFSADISVLEIGYAGEPVLLYYNQEERMPMFLIAILVVYCSFQRATGLYCRYASLKSLKAARKLSSCLFAKFMSSLHAIIRKRQEKLYMIIKLKA